MLEVDGTRGLNNPRHQTCGRCQAGLEILVDFPLLGQSNETKMFLILVQFYFVFLNIY